MIQEDKELLLKDLCARLPYGVFVKEKNKIAPIKCDFECHPDLDDLENVKPYLRPMSSMTEEEKKELGNFAAAIMFASQNKNHLFQLTREALVGDFFNKHHIDYRGLIEKGLALKATEGMYNLKK